MQKLFVNILIRAYNFKMKRIPSSFKHFYAEKQNVMFYHPTPYFHRPSNSSNNESLLLLFWWPLESEGPVCYYHVTYAFQSEYTLCSSLNVKEHLSRNRRDIWSLSEYRTDKYSQRKSIIWPVWQNGWVFVYELNDCGFEYCFCHI